MVWLPFCSAEKSQRYLISSIIPQTNVVYSVLYYIFSSILMPLAIVKVVIADDHVLFREGLKRVFALEKDILVVGEASNGPEAVEVVARRLPDVLLLDLKMPAGDAADSLARL